MNIKNEVYQILVEVPATRDNDQVLYIEYMKRKNPIFPKMPYSELVLNLETLGLPTFETISRLRRLVQADIPEVQQEESER